MEIYCVKLPSYTDNSRMQSLLYKLPLSKQQKIMKFVRKEDALRALTSEILSRSVICDRLKVKNSDIEFCYNDYGKPFLKKFDGLQFNNSHSGDWVVCAIDTLPIGIDVEKISAIDFDIAGHFFSKQECRDLFDKEDERRLGYFFDLWTLKESYIKAAGKGLSIPLDSFTIRVTNKGVTLETQNEFKNCFLKQYEIDVGYRMAVCAMHNCFCDNVILRDFYSTFLG